MYTSSTPKIATANRGRSSGPLAASTDAYVPLANRHTHRWAAYWHMGAHMDMNMETPRRVRTGPTDTPKVGSVPAHRYVGDNAISAGAFWAALSARSRQQRGWVAYQSSCHASSAMPGQYVLVHGRLAAAVVAGHESLDCQGAGGQCPLSAASLM